MDNVINLKINGKEVTAVKGQTILQVAKKNGIDIPNMCYSEKVKVYGACGVCVVEAKGMPKLMRSCASEIRISHGCIPEYFSGALARSMQQPPQRSAISPTLLERPPAPLSVTNR